LSVETIDVSAMQIINRANNPNAKMPLVSLIIPKKRIIDASALEQIKNHNEINHDARYEKYSKRSIHYETTFLN